MKDLQKLAKEAIEDVLAIDIEPGNIREFKINTRAKTRWGQCSYNRASNTYSIEISDRLLKDEVSYEATMNTIIHEILHTCKNCMNHGKEWQNLAERVNSFYPIYTIKRTTSPAEKGIIEKPDYKYCIKCEDCGYKCFYLRKGRVVSLLQSGKHCCMCGKCSSHKLKLINL